MQILLVKTLDLSNSSFLNKKIANLILKKEFYMRKKII